MSRRPSRHDLDAARRDYLAAVRRLHQAMTMFHSAGVPLATDLARVVQPWTSDQVRAVIGLRDAWTALVESRRSYEKLLRDDAS